jgi:hypothetical protein
VLNGPWSDVSLLRNALLYSLSRAAGRSAPLSTPVPSGAKYVRKYRTRPQTTRACCSERYRRTAQHLASARPSAGSCLTANKPLTHVHTHVCACVCMCVCMHACIYVCLYVCLSVCMHACMYYVCMIMYACMYLYTYVCVSVSVCVCV